MSQLFRQDRSKQREKPTRVVQSNLFPAADRRPSPQQRRGDTAATRALEALDTAEAAGVGGLGRFIIGALGLLGIALSIIPTLIGCGLMMGVGWIILTIFSQF